MPLIRSWQNQKGKSKNSMDFPQTTYGIIGYPVKHSLSPVMHNAAFQALEVDATYKLFPLAENELDDFFQKLREKTSPVFGLNVTVPYKEKILPYLDTLAPLAQRIGAVNTIVINKERKLTGYNTDAPGFLAHLSELKFNLHDKRITILGAGGSARAILVALCLIPERPQSIRLYNRTSSRTDELLKSIGSRVDVSIVEPVSSIDDLNIELADLLINTTSLGMKEGDPCVVDEHLLHSNILVYDLIYNPKETVLLKMAKAKEAQIANGLGMLFYQGVLAFQHWAGIPLRDETKNIMREVLEREAFNE